MRANFKDKVIKDLRYDVFAGLTRFHGGLAILVQPLNRVEDVVLLESEWLVSQELYFTFVAQLQSPQFM